MGGGFGFAPALPPLHRNTIYAIQQYKKNTKRSIQFIQYNAIQYNAIHYTTIQYNTIQYNTIQAQRPV